jgi:hypothetical protein
MKAVSMSFLPRRVSPTALALAALTALVNAGCKKPLTHLVVDIDTDVPMGALPELNVQCGYGWDGMSDTGSAPTCDLLVTRGPGGAVSARVCLPASFGVRVDPRNEGRAFTMVVSGASGNYRRIMTITPPPEEVRLLRVRVHSACLVDSPETDEHPCDVLSSNHCTLSESCIERGMTCGNTGTCIPRVVPPGSLVVIPRTGPEDASLTQPVGGQCPLSDFGARPPADAAVTPEASAPPVDAAVMDAGASGG